MAGPDLCLPSGARRLEGFPGPVKNLPVTWNCRVCQPSHAGWLNCGALAIRRGVSAWGHPTPCPPRVINSQSRCRVSALQPMDIFAMPRNPVPPEGTLPRCRHSHYSPNGDAWHCEACHPIRPRHQRPVFIPVDSGTPLNDTKIHANKSDNNSSACPQCGSRIHYDNGSKWECVECSTRYRAPKRKHAPECELESVAA
jgi:hypothetical protein